MADRYTFETADQMIDVLKKAHSLIEAKSDMLFHLFTGLAQGFRDKEFETLSANMYEALQSSKAINDNLLQLITRLSAYRNDLMALVNNEWGAEVAIDDPPPVLQATYDTDIQNFAENRRRKRLQQEVEEILHDNRIPVCARRAYEHWGKKCPIKSCEYNGTAFYSPSVGFMKFNFGEDMTNPCGKLSTFFHEIGHMIDYSVRGGQWLSNDSTFEHALRRDWAGYLVHVQQRYACDAVKAMGYIRKELMTDNNLYADVSDIIGALTNCQCQNLWGHDLKYWQADPSRIQKEAFANMYSVTMGEAKRAAVMREYFPTAYGYFLKILEGC